MKANEYFGCNVEDIMQYVDDEKNVDRSSGIGWNSVEIWHTLFVTLPKTAGSIFISPA